MNRTVSNELRKAFEKVKPAFPELFNTAYAICGNFDTAEYALRSAFLSIWQKGGRIRSQERLRRAVIRSARRLGGARDEITWDGLKTEGEAVAQLIGASDLTTRRALALSHGCGLTDEQVGKILSMSGRAVDDLLEDAEQKAALLLPGHSHGKAEQIIRQTVQKWMKAPNEDMPEPSNVFRALEAEAEQNITGVKRVTGALGIIALAIAALLIGAIFWVVAVLSVKTGV